MNSAVSQSVGFTRASDILAKNRRSPLEERLLSGLQWAGRASVEERREEAFLLFVVSLESLLLNNKENEQITQRFALRGAHLLGKDFFAKKQIRTELKKLYGLRSAIVHSGSTEVTDANRDLIRHFARAAIYTILMTQPFSGMSKEEELESWFEDQVLGGHP